MQEIVTEKHTGNELLKRYLATHPPKIAYTPDDLYVHSVMDDNGEEVDDFQKKLKQWRKEGDERNGRID
jgi:hypothetical protein